MATRNAADSQQGEAARALQSANSESATVPTLSAWLVAGLASAHALMFIWMFPGIHAWPLAFVVVAPLAVIGLRTTRPKRDTLIVLGVCWLQWLWMSRWTIEVTAAGYPLMALCLAMYPALFVVLLSLFARTRRLERWPAALLVPIVWGGLEFLRGRVAFDGYPWFLLAHPTIEWLTFAQGAAVVGTYGLGLLVAGFNGLVVDALLMKPGLMAGRSVGWSAAILAALAMANLALGWQAMRAIEQSTLGRSHDLTVLAIQTNLPQDNKMGWTIEQQMEDLPGFAAQTMEALQAARELGSEIDLICWPETMVPGAGFEHDTQELIAQFGPSFEHLYRWAELVRELVRHTQIPMLVGSGAWVDSSVRTDSEGMYLDRGREFNSAYLISPASTVAGVSQDRVDKFFLTPFGETMPYISAWPWLEEKMLAVGARGMSFTLDAADEIRALDLVMRGQPSSTFSLLTPICFEDTVPWLVRRQVLRSDDPTRAVIVNLSNDGWFGSYDPGRTQHVQIARFRCIENRVPMVRCVNTGLSVHVDAAGKLIDVVGSGRYGEGQVAGWLVAEVFVDGRPTLYRLAGDWPGWLALTAMIALLVLRWRLGRADTTLIHGTA